MENKPTLREREVGIMRAWLYLPLIESPSPAKCKCGAETNSGYALVRINNRILKATGKLDTEGEVCLEKFLCSKCFKQIKERIEELENQN